MKKTTETKSTLARLLAKENITVTHGNMKTAYFDVKNRVLGLPTWKDRGQDVEDMLIGHEVGHALYTPEKAVEDFRAACGTLPFDVCNIVEDIRIERMIKDTYPGLPRIFKKAYTVLVEKDFFSIAGKDVSSLKFLDRLNLRGKIGDIANIPLDAEEEVIYQKCLAAETFEDVLEICKEIASNYKDEPKEEPAPGDDEESSDSEGDETPAPGDDEESADENESTSTDDGENAEGEENDSDSEDEESNEGDASSSDIEADENAEVSGDNSDDSESEKDMSSTGTEGGFNEDELTSDTLREFENAVENDVEMPFENGYMPGMLPRRSYVNDMIISYKQLAESRGNVEMKLKMTDEQNKKDYGEDTFPSLLDSFVTELPKLKKKTSKKVGVLVREFERRKAAYQYSRSTEARTGVIDVNKLHSYKITDEIFLSKSLLADAKSHGMIFLIDYSGSMSNVLPDVIEQTLNLVEFCKKVGIPFDVYSFTSGYYQTNDNCKTTSTINEVDLRDVILIHQLSSSMSKGDYTESTKNLWAQYWLQKRGHSRLTVCSKYERLGGTPLDTVLTMMYTIVKDFVAKHRVQKTMFVTLTDGDSSRMQVNYDTGEFNPTVRMKTGDSNVNINIYNGTVDMMKLIGTIPSVTTLGFFLPSNDRASASKISGVLSNGRWVNKSSTDYKKAIKSYKKDGFLEVKEKMGYNSYIVLNSNVKIEDKEFEHNSADEIATSRKAQTKLAKEFSKHHGESKKNRVLMSRIAEMVA